MYLGEADEVPPFVHEDDKVSEFRTQYEQFQIFLFSSWNRFILQIQYTNQCMLDHQIQWCQAVVLPMRKKDSYSIHKMNRTHKIYFDRQSNLFIIFKLATTKNSIIRARI